MLIEFCGTSAMGKTTMARLLSRKDSRYRPFRRSVAGSGYKHRLSQLRLFSKGIFFAFDVLIKKRNFYRFLKLSMYTGAKQDTCRWILDQGYLQPTALLKSSEEYKIDTYISKVQDIDVYPDVVVFFLATPDLAEKRQSMRGDIETIKDSSENLGFSSLNEQYKKERQLWLDLIPFLEKKSISVICLYFDNEGKINKTIASVGGENNNQEVVGELVSFFESYWDSSL